MMLRDLELGDVFVTIDPNDATAPLIIVEGGVALLKSDPHDPGFKADSSFSKSTPPYTSVQKINIAYMFGS